MSMSDKYDKDPPESSSVRFFDQSYFSVPTLTLAVDQHRTQQQTGVSKIYKNLVSLRGNEDAFNELFLAKLTEANNMNVITNAELTEMEISNATHDELVYENETFKKRIQHLRENVKG